MVQVKTILTLIWKLHICNDIFSGVKHLVILVRVVKKNIVIRIRILLDHPLWWTFEHKKSMRIIK